MADLAGKTFDQLVATDITAADKGVAPAFNTLIDKVASVETNGVPAANLPSNGRAAGVTTAAADVYTALGTLIADTLSTGRAGYLPKGSYNLGTRNRTVSLPVGARWALTADPGALLKINSSSVTVDYHTALIVESDGTGDVELIDISGLGVDHNRRGQSLPGGAYDWEHSASLRVSGTSATSRLLRVNLRNLYFRDPIADCVWCNTYYVDTLLIDGMHVRDRNGTRSCIEFSGIPRLTQISNFVGWRIESESVTRPGDVTWNSLIQIDNAEAKSAVDLSDAERRTTVAINNLMAKDFTANGIAGRITNSQIHFSNTTTGARRLNYLNGVTFDNCDIYIYADASGVVDPVTIYVQNVSLPTDTAATFTNCRFVLVPHASLPSGPFTGAALKTQQNTANIGNYTFRNCWWDARFAVGVLNDRTANVEFINCDGAGTSYFIDFTGSATVTKTMTITGGTFERAASLMRIAPGGAFTTLNLRLEQTAAAAAFSVNGSSTPFGTLVTNSNRLIYVASTPPVSGFRGDRARLVTPVAGVTSEWRCTVTSTTAATWEPMPVKELTSTTTALAAIGNAINTTDKYVGKQVVNTTTHKLVHAAGSAAGDVWYDAAGVSTHTPV